ncbi:hypothetical protein F6X40_24130 [Paraburkholderia sp. UCT31]|uniref:hypothetical protein n=1 Tax=Paraburkholderia sp. UCT31 TaxID=2615209 RepID=UPI0016560941|nr:hypothetical protein [Paraburkholderia sp. UCT31]MBC8739806.1 hypothetical protein [Paraburkholderia sp. UCT31]
MAFDAFKNDDEAVNIEGDAFTVENGSDRVVFNGELEIRKDKAGLKAALALKDAVDSVVAALQADKALPEHAKDETVKPGKVDNPFA